VWHDWRPDHARSLLPFWLCVNFRRRYIRGAGLFLAVDSGTSYAAFSWIPWITSWRWYIRRRPSLPEVALWTCYWEICTTRLQWRRCTTPIKDSNSKYLCTRLVTFVHTILHYRCCTCSLAPSLRILCPTASFIHRYAIQGPLVPGRTPRLLFVSKLSSTHLPLDLDWNIFSFPPCICKPNPRRSFTQRFWQG
jgi:hypothetical protein